MMRLVAGIAIALMVPAVASAATQIYKCTKADGAVVFAPTPCGNGAKEVGASSTAKALTDTPQNHAIRDISDGVDDAHCRDSAHALYRTPDDAAINRAQNELQAVESRTWTGRNEAAAQILNEQDRTRAASLRALISSEQARIDSARADSRRRVDDALAKCADLTRKRQVDRDASQASK